MRSCDIYIYIYIHMAARYDRREREREERKVVCNLRVSRTRGYRVLCENKASLERI